MMTAKYVISFANYNQWQNINTIEAADELSEEQRKQDVGAFFGSIQGTLSHLLWGDSIWLDRLTHTQYKASPIDQSGSAWSDWEEYKIAQRNGSKAYSLGRNCYGRLVNRNSHIHNRPWHRGYKTCWPTGCSYL